MNLKMIKKKIPPHIVSNITLKSINLKAQISVYGLVFLVYFKTSENCGSRATTLRTKRLLQLDQVKCWSLWSEDLAIQ